MSSRSGSCVTIRLCETPRANWSSVVLPRRRTVGLRRCGGTAPLAPPTRSNAASHARQPVRADAMESAELAVFAAAAVVAGEAGLLLVAGFLADDAEAHAGDGLAACLWNLRIAFLAAHQAGSLRELAAHALDRILDGGVDLVLYSAVAGPACGHGSSPDCYGAKHSRRDMNSSINRAMRA